ncbi:MAG TPA: hypothetical protein V6D17_00320 [Candidatus Obscuribacterales bacterium]
MKKTSFPAFAMAMSCLIGLPGAAQAEWGSFTFKDGYGEEITVKNSLFGTKSKVIKDRIGDKYSSKQGLFGGKATEVAVLGNSLKRKKGWFGRSETEAKTILGDSFKTKKGILGNRTTTVDLSGVSALVKQFVGAKGATTSSLLGQSGFNSLSDALENTKMDPIGAPAKTPQLPSAGGAASDSALSAPALPLGEQAPFAQSPK